MGLRRQGGARQSTRCTDVMAHVLTIVHTNPTPAPFPPLVLELPAHCIRHIPMAHCQTSAPMIIGLIRKRSTHACARTRVHTAVPNNGPPGSCWNGRLALARDPVVSARGDAVLVAVVNYDNDGPFVMVLRVTPATADGGAASMEELQARMCACIYISPDQCIGQPQYRWYISVAFHRCVRTVLLIHASTQVFHSRHLLDWVGW